MAMRAGYDETVCVVTVVGETTEHPNQDLLEYASVSHTYDISSDSSGGYEVIAVHTDGGNGTGTMDIPKTLKQALSSDEAEFWSEAVLDEVSNLEDVFSAFGPPVPHSSEMSVTPTRFFFPKKIVSLAQRQQDGKSKAYKEIPGSSDYERFRARLLYVNNKYTSVQSSWEELFAPVVDKTSVRIFLTTCTLCRRVRLDS